MTKPTKSTIIVGIAIVVIIVFIGVSHYFGFKENQTKGQIVYNVPIEEPSATICNDCHTQIFSPEVMGKKFYFGTWNLNPQYLVPVIDSVGDTIHINPDEIRLPKTIVLSILIDASHGRSLDPKYIQQWVVTSNTWLKLASRTNDWVLRTDVLYRIK